MASDEPPILAARLPPAFESRQLEDAPFAAQLRRVAADRALVPGAEDRAGQPVGLDRLQAAVPVALHEQAGVGDLLHRLQRLDAAGLVDRDVFAAVVEKGAAGLVGQDAEPGRAGRAAVGRQELDVGSGLGLHRLAGGDEIVPGRDLGRVDAGGLIHVAAVEHHGRAGIPGHGVDLVADGQLRQLEFREFGEEVGLLRVERLQVREAVREAGPEHLGLMVLDRIDVRHVDAAGGAAGQAAVIDRLVAQVLDRHLDVRIGLVEVGDHGLQAPSPPRSSSRP